MRARFLELDVVRLSERLATLVWNMVRRWDSFARWTIGAQIVDAADGVGANLSEGAGRGHPADNRRFVRIARGCLNETHFFLRQAYRRQLMSPAEAAEVRSIIEELSPKVNAYLSSIKDRADPMRSPSPGQPKRSNNK